jgi:ATP phosphoribosyltransferase
MNDRGEIVLRIALTKGRLEEKCVKLFMQKGLDCTALNDKGRRLILPVGESLEAVLAKGPDVITFVSHGVCDMGITGKDMIAENADNFNNFYEVADLGFGKCKFAVAAKKGSDIWSGSGHKIIATKYPKIARDFFDTKGMDIEIVKIEGSVELAPLLSFADAIVDIVETGETLRENGLEVIENIFDISARLIVNTASMKLKRTEIADFIEKIKPLEAGGLT